MLGLMQDWPLTWDKILDHAARFCGDQEVVTRSVEGPITRTTYAEVHTRAKKLTHALKALGIGFGDRVGTLAWNTARHLETWYGILGMGAVYHTLNPRLFPEQLVYIINHGEDRVIVTDLTFVPLLEKLQDKLPTVEAYIILTDTAHMPETSLKNAHCYEALLAEASADVEWGGFEETTAAGLCYTSGTTGDPKGVLYSHRSNVIHALSMAAGDGLGMRGYDAIMPVVPMFHANAWAIAFIAPMLGAKLVMPGAKMDGASIYELIDTEKVSYSAAVPTVWLMLLQHLEAENLRVDSLRTVAIGGAACPPRIIETFEREFGVEVLHLWGMTEMSPIGTLAIMPPKCRDLPLDDRLLLKRKQGRPPFAVEMRIVDDAGQELPRDGETSGNLEVRGPAVAKGYFKGAGQEAFNEEGWFHTGDVATLDQDGFMTITDRSKDVIKSGGEWISSIELENLAVGHPKAAECAVIGLPHPKWDERPLLVVQLKAGKTATKQEFYDYLQGKIAKWWTPDDIVFVDDMPHTATGKLQKRDLRDRFKDHSWPQTAA
ncbi:MAG: long-chain-fatty-acid--CoA ligase [Maricaulaceae bacterium]